MMKEQLLKYLSRYITLEEAEFEKFYSCLEYKTYQKKEFLVQEGEVCKHKFFILKGLTRSFYIDGKGNEQIVLFGIENWWVTNIESFVREIPAELCMQALEETTVLAVSKKDLENLYTSIPKLERLFRIITENMLIAIQRRYEFYQKMSSKERYDLLVESLPHFVQRVPQYMIASYLEITPEYLSELRKKK